MSLRIFDKNQIAIFQQLRIPDASFMSFLLLQTKFVVRNSSDTLQFAGDSEIT